MTPTAPGELRALAFGDVDGGIWGAALNAGAPLVLWGGRAGATASAATIDTSWDAGAGGWRLEAVGIDLRVEPAGQDPEPAGAGDAAGTITVVQELCRVEGTVALEGSEHCVDCVGTRCAIDGVDAASLGSARAVSGWFADDDAFLLLALRAAGNVGQEGDLVAATLFDPDGWVSVDDPRLSTTYAAAGLPARAGLELWIGEGENEFPRRAAGEAAGDGAAAQAAGLELRAVPLRCHARGREGSGVYLLAQF
jgi:hypothetical protein